MLVTKLLISPVKIRIFCPKKSKFGLKMAFLFFLGQALPAHLVGGCGARAVSRKTLLYLYFLLCWIWQSCGLTCHVSFVSRPFCFKCHSHLRHLLWGVEGRWEKLEKNFTLVFHLKSDWKWNLLFRSSSCASSLSQVEKKN